MTIREWLNSGKNFDIGVALYNAYGTDNLLKNMFAQGFSDLRAKRLFQELLALKETDNIYMPEATPEPVNINVAAAAMPEQMVAPDEDSYRLKWLPLYQEMNMLRHNLEGFADIKDRGAAAFRILALEKECMRIWEERDYACKTGTVKDAPKIEEPYIDPNSLQRRINTVRSAISKYSRPPETDKRKALLKQYQDELEKLYQQQRKTI